MDRLHFGARARRRRRIRKFVSWCWIFSMIGMVAGIPGTNLSLGLLHRLFGETVTAQSAGTVDTSAAATGMLRFQHGLFRTHPTPSATPTAVVGSAATPVDGTASPASTSPSAPSSSIEATIYSAAAEFGLSGTYLVGVAECESHLDPGAYNAAGYYGLFQFDETTWAAYGYGSIYDPVAQARTAARLLAAGQSSRWPNCA